MDAKNGNARWSMDFVSDALADGRGFRTLNLVDDLPARAWRSRWTPRRSCACWNGWLRSALPASLVMDNGPEFTGKALDAWAHRSGVKLHFIRPVENAHAESFNGRFRDEDLNENWFTNLLDARTTL